MPPRARSWLSFPGRILRSSRPLSHPGYHRLRWSRGNCPHGARYLFWSRRPESCPAVQGRSSQSRDLCGRTAWRPCRSRGQARRGSSLNRARRRRDCRTPARTNRSLGQIAAAGVAFSPGDGQRLAAATSEGPVYVWNLKNDSLIATLPGHSRGSSGAASSAAGRFLATAAALTVRSDSGTSRPRQADRRAPPA